MKIIKWLDEHFEESLLVLFLAVITFTICLQVVMRYVFNNSLSWPEELSRYLFIGTAFLSISYCIKMNSSIKIDVVLGFFPNKIRKIVNMISLLVIFVFFVYMFTQAITVTAKAYTGGQRSAALHMPMYFLYLFVLAGFFLSVVRSLQRICLAVKDLIGDS